MLARESPAKALPNRPPSRWPLPIMPPRMSHDGGLQNVDAAAVTVAGKALFLPAAPAAAFCYCCSAGRAPCCALKGGVRALAPSQTCALTETH